MERGNQKTEMCQIGFCPQCFQGYLVVYKDEFVKKLVVSCEECCVEWNHPLEAYIFIERKYRQGINYLQYNEVVIKRLYQWKSSGDKQFYSTYQKIQSVSPFGIPSITYMGIQQKTYASFSEVKQAGWEDYIIHKMLIYP